MNRFYGQPTGFPRPTWSEFTRSCERSPLFSSTGGPLKASLEPTALVNETWLRLARRPWKSRSHFLARLRRRCATVLVDYVRARLAEKRGGEWTRISIDAGSEQEGMAFSLAQVLDVHNALERLSEIDARKARVVEMRFFGGMDFDEIAEALNVSLVTAKRDWQFSRAWLYDSLTS